MRANALSVRPAAARLCAAAALVLALTARADDFIAGADLSHLAFFEARGVVYRQNGQVRDALTLLKERGVNCVRLRLFTSSADRALADPYNCINNLDYTLPLAVRVKQAGLRLMLDFHYSDTWADPGHQAKPAAWTNLAFAALAQEVRGYSSNCIAAFVAAGARPDYVQIGNEIISGLLWPDGNVGGTYDISSQWLKLGQLLKAAGQGVREAAGSQPPGVIVHIDRGGSWSGTQWFFDRLTAQGVDYDILGQSYYPFWHGSLEDLRSCLTNAAARYGKPVMVVETAFPWSNSTNLYGIPATPDGQVQYVAALAQVVRRVPGRRGAGILWWGAEYQRLAGYNLAGFNTRSFFDAAGNVLPVADAVGQLAAPLKLSLLTSDRSLVVRWPLSGAGASLTAANSLSDAAAWSAVTNPVQCSAATFQVQVSPGSNLNRFYRLVSD